MPKDEFDFDDPWELNGVALFTDEDTTEAMCECFIEEFMRLGYNPKQILALFRNPHYLGMNLALQKRGERFVRDQIAEVFARWGRPVPWSESATFHDPQASAADEGLGSSDAPRRDTISPEQGEGRGEGCDRPRRSSRDVGPSPSQQEIELDASVTDPMGAPIPKLPL